MGFRLGRRAHVIGVELSPDRAHAVVLDAWPGRARKTFATDWDPTRPAELVAQLMQQLGPTRRIALSVGFGFLYLKHVKLPPVPAAERRRMIALEPDRFFPVQDQALVVALAPETNVAFAADAEQIQQWIAAFERWGAVENVEPAPLSLARALGKTVRATFVVPAGAELGLIEVHAGRVEAARRTLPAAASADARALPNVSGLKGDFLAALGAARGVNSALDAMLLSDDGAARVKRRRGVRLSWTAAVCSLAFGLALWTVDRSRDRTLERIRSEVLQISPRAQEAMQLRERLAAIEREARAIGELAARRPDPLPVLAALSERLPAGAIVLSIKADGADWQIDGTASDAAALVPLLDRDNRFQDVRFLSASSRFQDGNRTAETFSIAFRVSAQP